MTPLQIKIVTALIVAIVLSVLSVLGTQQIMAWRDGYEQAKQQKPIIENTGAAVKEGADLDDFNAGFNAGLQQGRDTFHNSKEEAKRNEPETAKRAATAVPDSVRRAFRERRAARERLGCAGSECAQDDRADVAAER